MRAETDAVVGKIFYEAVAESELDRVCGKSAFRVSESCEVFARLAADDRYSGNDRDQRKE
jgi:hypothetical protein